MRGRRFHPDVQRRFSERLGCPGLVWALLACAASLGVAGCGLCGGQTGDCSSPSASRGAPASGGSQGSQAGADCDVARSLTLDERSEDGFTARAVLREFAGTYTGAVAADANGAAGASNQAGAGGGAGPVNEADAARATSSLEDAGAVDAAEPTEVLVTVSHQNGAARELSCSHQIQVKVQVEVSVGALKEPPTPAWLVGDTRGAKLVAQFAATREPEVPALSLELIFDSTGASGTLRPADADAAGPAHELRLTRAH
jgi:hypothetical protein